MDFKETVKVWSAYKQAFSLNSLILKATLLEKISGSKITNNRTINSLLFGSSGCNFRYSLRFLFASMTIIWNIELKKNFE